MQQLLSHISEQAATLKRLQPLSAENAARLNKKFRLEWNYNSNHIEGNTLTYGETELFLIFGETKGNHEYREYEEMQGHDVALKMVEELAEDKERILNEQFIRQLNQVILKKPFYKEAITPDGQATRRLIKVGEYKSLPNSVLLQNGEIFHYASPAETPAKMDDLMTWYREAAENNQLHPVELAAELHYRFVLIHPFDDGNGRISRLLMNYHLLKNDLPPVIIKSADKKNYLRALHEADTGNLSAFIEYIAEQLLWSYDISIKAAKGASIDEPGDWEKKLALLNQKANPATVLEKRKSELPISEALTDISLPILDFLFNGLTPITTLFFHRQISILISSPGGGGSTGKLSEIEPFRQYFLSLQDGNTQIPEAIDIYYDLIGFKKNGSDAFDIPYIFKLVFLEYTYEISIVGNLGFKIERLYHQKLTGEDKELIANTITEDIIKRVEGSVTNK